MMAMGGGMGGARPNRVTVQFDNNTDLLGNKKPDGGLGAI